MSKLFGGVLFLPVRGHAEWARANSACPLGRVSVITFFAAFASVPSCVVLTVLEKTWCTLYSNCKQYVKTEGERLTVRSLQPAFSHTNVPARAVFHCTEAGMKTSGGKKKLETSPCQSHRASLFSPLVSIQLWAAGVCTHECIAHTGTVLSVLHNSNTRETAEIFVRAHHPIKENNEP